MIGLFVGWLLGVYSSRLGPSSINMEITWWVSAGAIAFGLVGLLFGSKVGTAVGAAIAAIFHFER
jgi:hypothetical protein